MTEPDEHKTWITNNPESRKSSGDWATTVGVLGTLIIICTTIILLVKL